MNEFRRGMQVGLQMAVEASEYLEKSPAFFVSIKEWEAYKMGVEDYKKRLEEVRDL